MTDIVQHIADALTAAGHKNLMGAEALRPAGRLGLGIVLDETQPTGRAWNTLNPIRTTGVEITIVGKSYESMMPVIQGVDDVLRDQHGKRPIIRAERTGLEKGSLISQSEEEIRDDTLRSAILTYDVRWLASE